MIDIIYMRLWKYFDVDKTGHLICQPSSLRVDSYILLFDTRNRAYRLTGHVRTLQTYVKVDEVNGWAAR